MAPKVHEHLTPFATITAEGAQQHKKHFKNIPMIVKEPTLTNQNRLPRSWLPVLLAVVAFVVAVAVVSDAADLCCSTARNP